MVDRELLQRRLERLEEYLVILRRLAAYSYEEFIANPERYGSAERFLQLSIELIDDMGNHVVADEELGAVAKTTDVPDRLAEHGLVDADLASRWATMIGFRNILVHEYMEIDRRLVHEHLRERLGDFDELRLAFVRLL
ncbi:MAG TPA: DUF86 domain-containing protein [Candidatus Latescibacteria bacterium]|jgi:uncharacterized protein YutE (UPF0331/DUF86 family)|nr:DUF86 domain-containing protein [Candidatus Latescibacterota bacterium]HJP29102.1 DUF86 domain-containing protein [Candidatus Latescibacterota bacterium]